MAALIIVLAAILLTLVPACCYLFKLVACQLGGKKLPPGSFGLPLVGESISFVRARKHDMTEEWIHERVHKFGPVFRTSLFGSNLVVLTGQVGNRLAFSGDDNRISYQQPKSISRILGKNNLFEISGSRKKLIRGAVVGYLWPESIQKFVGVMDSLVQEQLRKVLNNLIKPS